MSELRFPIIIGATLIGVSEVEPGVFARERLVVDSDDHRMTLQADGRSGYGRHRDVGVRHELQHGTIDEHVARFRDCLERAVAFAEGPGWSLARVDAALRTLGCDKFNVVEPAPRDDGSADEKGSERAD